MRRKEDGSIDWTPFDATMVCEGATELVAGADTLTEADQLSAWQYLIDTGLAWSLQGAFGRHAKHLIDAGLCHD
jgi:hypothetical protein